MRHTHPFPTQARRDPPKRQEDTRRASRDPIPVSILAQARETQRLAAEANKAKTDAPPPAPAGDAPNEGPAAGNGLNAVRVKTGPLPPKPTHPMEAISVEPHKCALPKSHLGAAYDIQLRVSTLAGGRVRVKPSSANFRVLKRPKQALAPNQPCEIVLAFTPSEPGKIHEHIEIISQHSAVRIPVTGTVATTAE